MKNNDYIEIVGAKAHNLKGASLSVPRGKFVVVTGLSGSGKSSLAFDTIYAEGQRRYMDTLSTYAKNQVIGNKGCIPWKIKGEQKRFKELTTGNVVIMGRRSYEEI